jgi:heptosyltransferase-2
LKSALVPFWAKIPQRTGFLGEWRWGWLNDIRPLHKNRLPMTVQRFVALGLAQEAALPPQLPRPMLQVDSQNVATALQRHGLERPTAPVLGLCPGAEYGPAKRWPADYFAEIARRKLAAGWRVWIFGSTKDTPAGREVAARSGKGCVDLTGKTTLAEAIDLLSLTTVVVSNDSGLMHVAAALDRPLVAIYGSSDPYCTPPLSTNAQILSLQLACSPCFQRRCPLGHLKCLRDLPPARVVSAIEQAVA